MGYDRLVDIERFLTEHAVCEGNNHKEVANHETEGDLFRLDGDWRERYKDWCLLTLTCEKMRMPCVWGLMRSMECGIVTAVIRSDEQNADRSRIFWPRESPTFFQRCTGTATSAISAITSAAGNKT